MGKLENYLIVALASGSVAFAPFASAHAGHFHSQQEQIREEQLPQPAPPPSGQEKTQELEQEVARLKKEVESLKTDAAMNRAMNATDRAAPRVSFIVAGVVFLAAGLFVRYFQRIRK